jgi:hypothetical protein
MSLEHSPQRGQRARRLARARQILARESDDEILTFSEWCTLNKIGERTGQRLIANGEGPILTQLAARRIGITRRANREWQASRARTA